MERSNYYFIFFFLDVGSDKAKSYFIFPIPNILQYPRIIKQFFLQNTHFPLTLSAVALTHTKQNKVNRTAGGKKRVLKFPAGAELLCVRFTLQLP
jgi:hypothetical protein